MCHYILLRSGLIYLAQIAHLSACFEQMKGSEQGEKIRGKERRKAINVYKGCKSWRQGGVMGERKGEMSSKLVRKNSPPDLIWTASPWAHRAQPASKQTLDYWCVWTYVSTCVCLSDHLSARNKLAVCQADFLARRLCGKWRIGGNFAFQRDIFFTRIWYLK